MRQGQFVQVGLWVGRAPGSTIEKQMRFPAVQEAINALTRSDSSPLFDRHRGVDMSWFGFEIQLYFADGTRTAPLQILGIENALSYLNEFV